MQGIVWVEGLLGVGKTTLARVLAEELDYRKILEPVDGNEYLQLFYGDQKRWAFAFQMDMLFRRWELHQLATYEALCGRGAILDRGMPGDMVFAEMHHESGNISNPEWNTYQRMYRSLASRISVTPRVMLFLDVNPEVALNRVEKRARESEKGLSMAYLVDLREHYLSMLNRIEEGTHPWASGTHVIRVDWNQDGLVIEPVVREVRAALSRAV